MTRQYTRAAILGALAAATAFVSLDALPAQSAAGVAPLTAESAAQLAQNANRRIIVVMKNQLRGAEAVNDQAPVLSELAQVHASRTKSFHLTNAVAATVSDGEVERLKANPAVAAVIPDLVIRRPTASPKKLTAAASASAAASTTPSPHVIPGACLPNGQVQLNPEALLVTQTDSDDPHALTARSLGVTGAGVKVAWIADGIDIHNINFIRPDGKSVFDPTVGGDYQDFSQDGPNAPTAGGEAFIDANAVAGQGIHTYDINGYSAQALPGPCNIRIEGVAPGVGLVGLKVYSETSFSTLSNILEAIEYAAQVDHVDVLNESLGYNPFPDVISRNLLDQANDAAVAAGVVVVVSSGDSGSTSTIASPSTDPAVISVGATTTFREYAQTNYGLARDFATTGWLNDNISSLSSGGFEESGRTVTLVAPGDLAWGSCSTDTAMYSDCVNELNQPTPVADTGGTSLSSPLTAGAAALVIEAYRKTHHGASPTPALVKQILASTASDLGVPATEQGAGLLNAYKAVLLAESIDCSDDKARPAGQTLLFSTNQLNAVGNPGSQQNWEVAVTNPSSVGQLVYAHGRSFGASENVQQGTVTLNDATSPKVANYQGLPNNYSVFKFKVPAQADRLNASIAYPSQGSETNLNERVRLTLIDPQGRLAAHSLPQGNGNFGNVDVRDPLPGTWTGIVFGDILAAGGTNGAVPWTVSTQRFASFGEVYPNVFFVAPGQRQTLYVKASTPPAPGDASGSIVLTSSGAGFDQDVGIESNSIAVTLRSLVSFGGSQSGAFSGILTGGNGRDLAPGEGQVQYYQFNVGWGVHDMTANVSLSNDAANPVLAYLVNPYGDTVGSAQNQNPLTFVNGLNLSASAVDPTPGLWTLIVNFGGPVVGNETSQPFHGNIQLNGVHVAAPGLPNSWSQKLTAGKAVKVPVTITNNGAAAQALFIDARLPGTQNLALTDFFTGNVVDPVTLPNGVYTPTWLVPTHTSRVNVSQTSSLPAQFELFVYPGNPGIESSNPGAGLLCALKATASYQSPVDTVSPGLWGADPIECGPYPAAAPAGTVQMTAVAVTAPFDPSVTSTTGDLWSGSTNPAATVVPVSVNPGQSITIDVTLTPSGPAGTVVRGMLYVDSFVNSFSQYSGNEMAGIPYEYTIE